MNAPRTTSRSRHRIWPWILGLILTPFVTLSVLIAGVIHLNSDAAALRRQVMAATGNGWHTKVQFSVGPVLLGAARAGVSFITTCRLRFGGGCAPCAPPVWECTREAERWREEGGATSYSPRLIG